VRPSDFLLSLDSYLLCTTAYAEKAEVKDSDAALRFNCMQRMFSPNCSCLDFDSPFT
jgi:hypothetical protein